MSKIKAIVSDVDRTLLDTEQFIFQAFLYTLSKYSLPPITREELNVLMGKSLEVCYETFAPNLPNKDLTETHRLFQLQNLHLATPFPNTLSTLKRLHDQGVKIAAVTTRSRRTSEKTLQLAGLMPYLTTVISQEDIPPTELKPHPRPILLALERMTITPSDAIMIGDANEDIEAGKRAGTKTIGVTYGSLGKLISESRPDYTIDDIAELTNIV